MYPFKADWRIKLRGSISESYIKPSILRWRLSWTHSIIVDGLINLQPLMGCLVTCVPLGAALSPDLRDNVLPMKGNGVCSKESAANWRRPYQYRSRHSQGGAFDHSLRTLMSVVQFMPKSSLILSLANVCYGALWHATPSYSSGPLGKSHKRGIANSRTG